MSWWIFLLITSTTITYNSCDKLNVDINDNDKQDFCSNKDDDSLCKNQVCIVEELLLPSIVRIHLMEENGRFM